MNSSRKVLFHTNTTVCLKYPGRTVAQRSNPAWCWLSTPKAIEIPLNPIYVTRSGNWHWYVGPARNTPLEGIIWCTSQKRTCFDVWKQITRLTINRDTKTPGGTVRKIWDKVVLVNKTTQFFEPLKKLKLGTF